MVLEEPKVVFDTNVASFIYNRNSRARFYESATAEMRPVISFQTLEEIMITPIKNGWGERRFIELTDHLERYEVIWPTGELVEISTRLRAAMELAGHRMDAADGWIAATAIYLDCPLATHDRDFIGVPGLRLITALG